MSTFCSRTQHNYPLNLTMLRDPGLQLREEGRQRCRLTLATFGLTDNVSTVLQPTLPPLHPSPSKLRDDRRVLAELKHRL